MKKMKKLLILLVASLLAVTMLVGCTDEKEDKSEEKKTEDTSDNTDDEKKDKYVIGLSQGTMNHPFRIAMIEENVAYAKEHYPEFEVIVTDGQNETARQVQDVEDLLARGIDLLLISPLTSEGLTDVVQKVLDEGIPVVALDRTVDTEVTTYVGAENKPMGVASADKLAEMTDGKARIVEVQGTAGTSATIDRHDGFIEQIDAEYPEMEIISTQYCDYLRENAMTFMEDTLQRFGPGEIDAVYAHNDEMALGALEAIKAAGRQDENIIIIGMDGTEVAFEAIRDGEMSFTVVYPYCAPEGMQAAYEILVGDGVDARIQLDTAIVSEENIDEWLGKGL